MSVFCERLLPSNIANHREREWFLPKVLATNKRSGRVFLALKGKLSSRHGVMFRVSVNLLALSQ